MASALSSANGLRREIKGNIELSVAIVQQRFAAQRGGQGDHVADATTVRFRCIELLGGKLHFTLLVQRVAIVLLSVSRDWISIAQLCARKARRLGQY